MPVQDTPTPTSILGQYVNFDDEQLTGQVIAVGGDLASVLMNWQEYNIWDNLKMPGEKPWLQYEWPLVKPRILDRNKIRELMSPEPKYLLEGVALTPKSRIIQPIQRDNKPLKHPQAPVAKSSFASTTPLRNRSGSSQEIEIMAKTAVFDSEDQLVQVYDSKKEAKAHNKGDDLKFVDAKSFPEGGIGEYATVEDLFPPKEKPVKAEAVEGEKRTRITVNYEGIYTVAKADGARFPEGDERGALHTALVENDTVEGYLAAAPEVAKFTSSRGAEQKVTAKGYLAYAVKRNWVKLANQADADAQVVVEEE